MNGEVVCVVVVVGEVVCVVVVVGVVVGVVAWHSRNRPFWIPNATNVMSHSDGVSMNCNTSA